MSERKTSERQRIEAIILDLHRTRLADRPISLFARLFIAILKLAVSRPPSMGMTGV